MTEINLILPDDNDVARYSSSFVAAIKEGLFRTPPSERELALAESDFIAYYEERRNDNFVFKLAGGEVAHRVPSTEYWMVQEDLFIGRIAIRHELSEHLERFGGHVGYAIRSSERGKGYGSLILDMALPKAKDLGLAKVLITCDENNHPSIKVIEKLGGVLQDKIEVVGRDVPHCRYWIEL